MELLIQEKRLGLSNMTEELIRVVFNLFEGLCSIPLEWNQIASITFCKATWQMVNLYILPSMKKKNVILNTQSSRLQQNMSYMSYLVHYAPAYSKICHTWSTTPRLQQNL